MTNSNGSFVSLSDPQKLAIEKAAAAAIDYRRLIKQRPARPSLSLDDAVGRFRTPLSEHGMQEVEAIDHVIGDADGGLHQMLNAPFDAGMILVRDRALLVASMSARGSYLPEQTDHWEPTDSTPELSSRIRMRRRATR